MARIYPFQPLRYTEKAGALDHLVTQPYDKITPEMRARYLALSPYNLVRIILGERQPDDSEGSNVYTRAAQYLKDWTRDLILAPDPEPAIYPYFQEFTEPDTGKRLVRKGFIALGAVEDYSAGIVHRHEQTLSGPKKDRLELLRHTHAHYGQLFMLYPDPKGEIDHLLDDCTATPPLAEVTDEYGTSHRFWRSGTDDRSLSSVTPQRIQQLMADKKLLIADGHHRYETALAFRNENPTLPGADRVMMTFVNMYSPGLKILATHRLVNGLADGYKERLFQASSFDVREIGSTEDLQVLWRKSDGRSVIGAAVGPKLFSLTEKGAGGSLDVKVLHEKLLGQALGIGEQAVREEANLHYIRGLEAAVEQARKGAAQIAFLLKPTSIQQVADTSFAGGVMPQKSTDFYPKLLSGLTIYRVDDHAQ